LEFRVIWKIEIEAGSPEDAAQQARAAQLRPDSSATVFEVWEYAEERMHRIDVETPADRLGHAELSAIRVCLRLLQCSPRLHSDAKQVVAAMLIFLDREEMMSRTERRGRPRLD
jgi:hypothetical protein